MKNTLVLFTKSFPYNHNESFLIPEFELLKKKFPKIIIIPLLKSGLTDRSHSGHTVLTLPEPSSIKQWKIVITYCMFFLPIEIRKNFNYNGILNNINYHYHFFKQSYIRAVAIENALKNENVNFADAVFYSYWLDENALSLVLLKEKYTSICTIGRGHGYDIFPEQAKFGYNIFQATLIKKLNRILSVSLKGTSHLKKKYPDQAGKIECSYLGTVDHHFLSPVDQSIIRIVSCAHGRTLKSIHRIPAILSLLDGTLEWIHIGGFKEIKYKHDVDQAIENAKKVNNRLTIITKGEMTNGELMEFYRNNAVTFFVSLSEKEGLPVTMMEAISYGIPLFSTDVGGCREICNEYTGMCVDAQLTNEEIAKQMTKFITYIASGKFPRENVKRFWKMNFSAMVNYTKLIESQLKCWE